MNITCFKIAAATALLMLGGTSLASANVITLGGAATGTGPYNLVSNATVPQAYSYVDVTLSTAISFSSINSLGAIFNDLAGGAEVGSPRIELDASNNDFFLVYLGTPPNFNDSTSSLNAFSGTNLDNASHNSADGNSGSYVTLASLEASFGADQITDIALILDGGYSPNPVQDLTLSGLTLNGTNLLAAAAPVPEPITLSLFGAGLAGAVAMRRRKAKKD